MLRHTQAEDECELVRMCTEESVCVRAGLLCICGCVLVPSCSFNSSLGYERINMRECVFQGQAGKGDTERVGEQVGVRERDFGLVATSLFHDRRNRIRDSRSPESSSLLKSTHRLSSPLPLW